MTWESESKKVGRRYVKYYEVDTDYCSRTFGVSPCLPAGSFFTDTFTGPDTTDLDVYGPYIDFSGLPGKGVLFSNKVIPVGGAYRAHLTTVINSPDHDISIDIALPAGASGSLFIRADAAYADAYRVEIDQVLGQVELRKTVSGSGTTVLSTSPQTITADTEYTYRLYANGTTISVDFNGTQIISATDSDIADGDFVAFGTSSTGSTADNLSVAVYAELGTACYNTRATCQFSQSYDAGTKTYRFFESTEDAYELGLGGFPLLKNKGISTEPTRITPGKGLGYRASLKVSLNDMRHHDRGVDPYVEYRTYTPEDQGTFWGKWLARNKYYTGRTVRIYDGFIGSGYSSANFREREYIIEKVDGPKKGVITFQCKDILRKLDTAQAPPASNTYLTAGISSSATTIPIDTTGDIELPVLRADGEIQYIEPFAGAIPAYRADGSSVFIPMTVDNELQAYRADGSSVPIKLIATEFPIGDSVRVRIGSELIDGTVASGQIESATRGAAGSTAEAHDAGSLVQSCIVFDNELPTDALRTLLAYAGITETSINTTTWDEQAAKWLGLSRINGTISVPAKVSDNVSRVSEQGTVYIWWDELTQLIELLAVAPQGSESALPEYSDELNFIESSVSAAQDMREQITQVWAYFDKIDGSGKNDPENMAELYIAFDSGAESATQWDRSLVKELNCEFVESTGHASSIASRTIGRLRDGEQSISFQLDVKDSPLWTGDEFIAQTDAVQAADGSQDTVRMQVVEVKEVNGGKYQYKAVKSAFQATRYAFIAPDTVSSSYTIATEEERDSYAFISNDLGFMSDGSEAYKII